MYRDPRIRVSDTDRDAIVARLNAATAEGRLNIDEFSYRAQRAYASRTWGELSRLVADLPAPQEVQPMPPPRKSTVSVSRLPLLALIFGALSIPTVACFPLGSTAAVAGIVLGALGIRSGNRGMAAAGIACGVLGLALQLVVFAVFGVMDAASPD
ncbi:DUF1707 SHOCT-like domain-containing protein [Actinoplanes aureus]|jgi:hypothetical protein|uniref:DUF1707 domain-containing protein n=1 Tax=Actinoplanes aureus TaxID=2792083 RepID=A0A931CMD6_9ACTN|nr:DUF1707 domain-containing protein [Actinoplanes aureus]MBG0567580.1 DUF1707 domain-containing protein [Actinoplanes aureus]